MQQKLTVVQARDVIKSALDSFLDKKFTLSNQEAATENILCALGYPKSSPRREKDKYRCIISVSNGRSIKAVSVKPHACGTTPENSKNANVVIGTPEID